MPLSLPFGAFVLVIDSLSRSATHAAGDTKNVCSSDTLALSRQLLDSLDAFRVEATWLIAPEADEKWVRSLVEHRQELAIDIGPGQSSDQQRKPQSPRHLANRLAPLTDRGVAVSALIVDRTPSQALVASAAQLGVRSIAVRPSESRATPKAQPRLLSHGCWEIPMNSVLPQTAGLFSLAIRRILREIDAAAEQRRPFQLYADFQSLVGGGDASQRVLTRVLRHVATRRQLGVLETTGVAGLVAQATGHQQSKPSRSILRPAA